MATVPNTGSTAAELRIFNTIENQDHLLAQTVYTKHSIKVDASTRVFVNTVNDGPMSMTRTKHELLKQLLDR